SDAQQQIVCASKRRNTHPGRRCNEPIRPAFWGMHVTGPRADKMAAIDCKRERTFHVRQMERLLGAMQPSALYCPASTFR
ncbi:hypothetical protein L2218_22525, partial [Xanthomonas perforans]|uniref:hypothetical protein n=1 Tax=Xanthomonas perforans TaxID=442694 RepID=UPI001F27F044